MNDKDDRLAQAMTLEQVRDLLRDSRALNFETLHHGMAFFNTVADAIDAHLRGAEPIGFILRNVDEPRDYWPGSFVLGEPQEDETEDAHWVPVYATSQPPAQPGKPVAWTRTDTINDDEGRPIGMDEPRVVWESECPDPAEGWTPLYTHPQPPAQDGRDRTMFIRGWRVAAEWARRPDLISDIGSPAWEQDLASAMAQESGE